MSNIDNNPGALLAKITKIGATAYVACNDALQLAAERGYKPTEDE